MGSDHRKARLEVTLEELEPYLRHKIGLIVGPGATLGSGAAGELAQVLQKLGTSKLGAEAPRNIDALIRAGIPASEIRKATTAFVAGKRGAVSMAALGATRWCSVLSATLDPFLEDALTNWSVGAPARPTITVVTDPFRQFLPPRTMPVFKLVGALFEPDFPLTKNDMRLRRPWWPRALQLFATYTQGGPTLCLGMGEEAEILLDLLGEMLADVRVQPGPLVFLQDDIVTKDGSLDDLAGRGIRVLHVKSDTKGILSQIKARTSQAFTPLLPFNDESMSPIGRLSPFADLCTVVNAHIQSAINSGETLLLRDLLFSPSTPQWDSFVHNLDFKRTITSEVVSNIKSRLLEQSATGRRLTVSGPSATGKTTVLKRAALDLAKEGTLVLWMRSYFFQDGPAQVRRLFDMIFEKRVSDGKRFVVFVDDPASLGSFRLTDIFAALASSGLEAVVVVSGRTSDFLQGTQQDEDADPDDLETDIVVPDKFDDTEWQRLPSYLVQLSVCPTEAAAKAAVGSSPSRATRDVLGMLYFLLPETRGRITESVREEYFRLGDRSAFSSILEGEITQSPDLLKKAYSFVAVSSKYGAPVPMEVLVSALGVSYDEWLEVSSPKGLIQGILYQDISEDSQSTVYRTRNDVVTEIVVNMINGGTMSRAGELSRMKQLLGGCNGSAPAYREYCVRVLVPGTPGPLGRLDYEEGAQLFDAAIDSLPMQDRTLLHHLGRWEKNKGNDTLKARRTLERALAAAPYPYASRTEAAEHIHTTMAANDVDAIKKKQIDPEEGKRQALAHLERARSGAFVNANAVHTQAMLMTHLVDALGTFTDPDSIAMIDVALGDIDRMVLILKTDFIADEERKDVSMLEDAREQVLDRCVSVGDGTADAEDLWTRLGRQEGFVLAARKLYGSAMLKGTGSDFKRAHEYCQEVNSKIVARNIVRSTQLTEVMLHIYFHWRVRRSSPAGSGDPIDWKYLEDLAIQLVGVSRARSDPFYNYVLAMAKAHRGDWMGSDAIFDELRKRPIPKTQLYEPRDFLKDDKGGMKRIQGIVKKGPSKLLLYVDALQHDFQMDRESKWARPGELAHAYVRFRFAGPLAVEEP